MGQKERQREQIFLFAAWRKVCAKVSHPVKEHYQSEAPLSPEQAEAAGAEIKAWATGDSGIGWRAELWRERVREYNRRYRLRHPERVRANRAIYQACWKAKQLGIPQPPLPSQEKPRGASQQLAAPAQKERKGVQIELVC